MLSLPRELIKEIVRGCGLFVRHESVLAHTCAWWRVPRAQTLLATCSGFAWLRGLELVIVDNSEVSIYSVNISGRRHGPWYYFTDIGGKMKFNGYAWYAADQKLGDHFHINPSDGRRSYLVNGAACYIPRECVREKAKCACRMCSLLASVETELEEADPAALRIAWDPEFRPRYALSQQELELDKDWVALCRAPSRNSQVAIDAQGLERKR